MMSVTFAVATVLVAVVTSAQIDTMKTPMTRLPVKPSTTTVAQTKDHVEHTTAGTVQSPQANPSTGAVNVASTKVNATTPKPETMTVEHASLRQKFKMTAVKCQEELHAPNDIVVLVANLTLVPQNEQQRCFMECVYKAMDLMKNNRFNGAQAKKYAQIRFADQQNEHKKVVTVIETCEKEAIIDPNNAEKCAAGRVIRNCFVKNILKQM